MVVLFFADCRFEESVCVLVFVSRFVCCVLSFDGVFVFSVFVFQRKVFVEEREGLVLNFRERKRPMNEAKNLYFL